MKDFSVVIPMANEEEMFRPFIDTLTHTLDHMKCGNVFMVIDTVSKDRTFELCSELSGVDERFITVWAPESRNVVDAYLRGYREALKAGYEFILEMDAGLSHDPKALPMFLKVLDQGNECAFGSRFISGGSIIDSNWRRTFLSRFGTVLSNVLLGTGMHDMTSGFQGFHASIVESFIDYPFHSKAHFYQTELRYLLRKKRYIEIPIHYRAPSPSVSKRAVFNSLAVLGYYFLQRVKGKECCIV
ncbi:MAG: glycosyltransferase [Desulfocapsa sp.]|nr:glycosyltransferase [Desulfocapsa sp.]